MTPEKVTTILTEPDRLDTPTISVGCLVYDPQTNVLINLSGPMNPTQECRLRLHRLHAKPQD